MNNAHPARENHSTRAAGPVRGTLFAVPSGDKAFAELMPLPVGLSPDKMDPGATPVSRPVRPAIPDAHVVEAGRHVLGALLTNNALFASVEGLLHPSDFAPLGLEQVADAIFSILNGSCEGVTVADSLTVAAQLPAAARTRLADLPALALEAGDEGDEERLVSYAGILAECGAEWKLRTLLEQAQGVANDASLTASERAAQVDSLLQAGQPHTQRSTESFAGCAMNFIDELAKRSEVGNMLAGISTGIADLDHLTSGLQEGNVIVLAARPSVGKTAAALGFAIEAALQGRHVLFRSYEMGKSELASRGLSYISGVDAFHIRAAALNEEEWGAMLDAARVSEALPLTFDDDTTSGLAGIRSQARRLKKAGKLDLLVIDYLQIMPANPRLSREQQVSEISRGLKLLSKELGIPIILLSQLNRSLEMRADRRPIMSDLRESGAIEQDADQIWFLHREEVYNPSTPDKGIGELIVAKQRNGPTGTVRLGYDGKTTRYFDLKKGASNTLSNQPSPARSQHGSKSQFDQLLPVFTP